MDHSIFVPYFKLGSITLADDELYNGKITVLHLMLPQVHITQTIEIAIAYVHFLAQTILRYAMTTRRTQNVMPLPANTTLTSTTLRVIPYTGMSA